MPPGVNVTTTTNQYLAPSWVDQVLRSNLFFAKILRNVEKWDGSQMLHPIKYQKGVSTVAFNGFDLLPITQQPVSIDMTFFPTFTATNIALAGSDLSINKTPLQKLNLMKVMMESRAQDAADDIGNFFQQDGSAYGGKAPMGLAGIVDNGSDLASYGGLSRATYPGLNATVTASGGTISLLKLRTLWNNLADEPIVPDLCITDYNTWGYCEALFTPFQRNTYTDFAPNKENNSSVSGYRALVWDGMVIYRDKKITTGNLYMINTDVTKFYSLKWYEGTMMSPKAKDVIENVYESADLAPAVFSWTNWIRAYNMLAINGFMVLGGQIICTAPFRNGVLTGILGT